MYFVPGSTVRALVSTLILAAAVVRAQVPDPDPAGTASVLKFVERCRADGRCPRLDPASPAAKIIRKAAGISAVNGASFQPGIAPGSWITIRGTDLAGTTRLWSSSEFDGNKLPTNLSGTSVTIGGKAAAIYYISPTQINALVPTDVPLGSNTLTVTSPIGDPASVQVNIDAVSPALFTFDPENHRYVAAVQTDGSFVGKSGLFPSAPAITHPLKAGGGASLYVNGLGTTNPPLPPGEIFPEPRPIANPEQLSVTIGGKPATVGFAGAVSPGLYQINITAPILASNDYPIQVKFGNAPSQDGAMITIQGDSQFSSLQATPASFAFNVSTLAGRATQSLQLTSTGEDFDFTLESSVPWLAFSKTSGHTPQSLEVTADLSKLTPGSYTGTITVRAPGTTTPSLAIPVSATVKAPAEISISRTSVAVELPAKFAIMSIPINVLAQTDEVEYTATTTGGDWLFTDPSGKTPAAAVLQLNTLDLPVGDYTGTMRIEPKGGGEAKEVSVKMTIYVASTRGIPLIRSVGNGGETLWGENRDLDLWGENLARATTASFDPPQGLAHHGASFVGDDLVSLTVETSPTAAEGPHMLTLTTASGASNPVAFNVRKGAPKVREIVPKVVYPGRFYAFGYDANGPAEFAIEGVDLAGTTSVQVTPLAGVSILNGLQFPDKVVGTLITSTTAEPGLRTVSVVTGAGRTNEITLEVKAPPANAPVISNFSVNPTVIDTKNFTVTYSGSFNFTDADGDIKSGAQIFLMLNTGTGSQWATVVRDNGTYLDLAGKTSGTVNFTFKRFYTGYTGTVFPHVLMMLQDAAGNLSNYQDSPVSHWDISF